MLIMLTVIRYLVLLMIVSEGDVGSIGCMYVVPNAY